MTRRPRVVVCGTKFGRAYLAAFRAPAFPFELAGVVAKGSQRSHRCATAYDVPLFTAVGDVPDDVEIACVVVGAGMNGGPGAELAKAFLARGMHVLQEHPLHHDELADCLREAHRAGRVYHLNTHYVHVEPVRRFVATARAVGERQRPLYVDAATSVQVAYTTLDILGAALGGVRPWALAGPAGLPADLSRATDLDVPFRSLDGVVGGVPLTLRTQHQLDAAEPDNHAHIFHRVTIGFEGGSLTLVNTYGPVVWTPRAHMPGSMAELVAMDDSAEPHLAYPTAAVVGPAEAPSYQAILRDLWPTAVRQAITALHAAATAGDDTRRRGQYHLTLCRLAQDVTARLGPVEIVRRTPPEVLSGADVAALADAPATGGAAPAREPAGAW
jgi:thiazolinyl imide reductase